MGPRTEQFRDPSCTGFVTATKPDRDRRFAERSGLSTRLPTLEEHVGMIRKAHGDVLPAIDGPQTTKFCPSVSILIPRDQHW